MSRVNPPPNIRLPQQFFDNSETRKYFGQIEFMLFQLWKRTGGGDDAIEDIISDEISNNSGIATLRAKMFSIAERVGALEDNDKSGILSSKISQINARIDELIDELLAELVLHRPNTELEFKTASMLDEQIKQLKLLNARVEEAFETRIPIEDIE